TVERIAYRPLRNAPRLAPLITAIGVSIILQHLALLVWSRNLIAFPQIIELRLYHLGSDPNAAAISNIQVAIILTSVLMMAGLIEALGAGYVGDWTNVCFLNDFLPGFADVCAASPESSLFGSNYKDVYAFIVLILVLVFRPQGLLGERVGDRA